MRLLFRGIPGRQQLLLEEIRFDSDRQREYEQIAFPHLNRRPPYVSERDRQNLTEEMVAEGRTVAGKLQDLILEHGLDVLVAENTNAMPMTLLGGLGVHEAAARMRVATIFHHHDFWWERSRFSSNHIEGLLNAIMPPTDIGLEHVVISSYAEHILRSLKRVQPRVIPNCEDFDRAVCRDDYNGTFRRDLGFREDDLLVVQPTRIVKRKRIEDSVELCARYQERYPEMQDRLHYIISLYQGDEPDTGYVDEIREYAAARNVTLHLISDRVASVRGTDERGRKVYTNRDVLANADIVTYLPAWEGFGNALLEAIAANVPVVTTTYLVYKTDIKITGLRNIEIRDRYVDGRLDIPASALEEMHRILTHPQERKELVAHNFEIARREFGFDTLRSRLSEVFREYGDEIRASRKRREKSRALYSV